jgi:hypothetical protein
MSLVRLKQLAQDGASPDEVIKWNDTAGKWEPGTGGGGAATDLATDGTDVAVNSTAPAAANYILKSTSTTVATWQLDTSGILTGVVDPTTEGVEGNFYYNTVLQSFWYKDSGGWENVGVLADDVTIEVDGTNGLQLIDAGTIATTKLSATGTKNSTTFLRGDDTWDVPIDTPKPTLTKSLTLETPTGTELFSFFYTPIAITLTSFEHYIKGTTNVQWQLMWGATADAGGTATHSTLTTSSTSGVTTVPTTDPDIPADSYLWLDTSAIVDTPTEFHLTVTYTED